MKTSDPSERCAKPPRFRVLILVSALGAGLLACGTPPAEPALAQTHQASNLDDLYKLLAALDDELRHCDRTRDKVLKAIKLVADKVDDPVKRTAANASLSRTAQAITEEAAELQAKRLATYNTIVRYLTNGLGLCLATVTIWDSVACDADAFEIPYDWEPSVRRRLDRRTVIQQELPTLRADAAALQQEYEAVNAQLVDPFLDPAMRDALTLLFNQLTDALLEKHGAIALHEQELSDIDDELASIVSDELGKLANGTSTAAQLIAEVSDFVADFDDLIQGLPPGTCPNMAANTGPECDLGFDPPSCFALAGCAWRNGQCVPDV